MCSISLHIIEELLLGGQTFTESGIHALCVVNGCLRAFWRFGLWLQ